MRCSAGVIDWCADRKKFSSDCKVKYKDFSYDVFMLLQIGSLKKGNRLYYLVIISDDTIRVLNRAVVLFSVHDTYARFFCYFRAYFCFSFLLCSGVLKVRRREC